MLNHQQVNHQDVFSTSEYKSLPNLFGNLFRMLRIEPYAIVFYSVDCACQFVYETIPLTCSFIYI